jgi:two-component system, sensor histidine kinase
MLTPETLAVLDSAPDAMLIVDAAGAIVFASRRAYTLFGYTAEEILRCGVEQLIPARFRRTHVEDRARFAQERRARPMGIGLELIAQRKDGMEVPVEISLSPIREGNDTLVVAAIRDVTERKRAQTELIAAREAAEAARRIADEARQAADRANLAKSRFLATASHDLRQPLQSLALLNGTLKRLIRDGDALEVLVSQEEAIGAMSRLLNALLDISKLESGAIKPAPADFAVASLLEALRSEFSGLASSKGIALEIPSSDLVVHGDATLVGQILRNLVSNAIKYTPAGRVRLSAQAQPPLVRIEVEDTGVGIAADELPRIYEEFYQIGVGPNAARNGYGLGLSIVRRLIQLLDLKLDVRSAVGQGSVFSLTLPLGEAQPTPERPRPARVSRPETAPLVLILDDDRAVREATRLLLKVAGYRVLMAGTLAEAVQAAEEHPDIALLVTDYHLGNDETGIQAITTMRELVGPGLKAVLITGDTSSAMRDLERDAHLRLVSKPINADELLEILQALHET